MGGTEGQNEARAQTVSPDEASEGPAGQHQETGQSKSQEAARGLCFCGGAERM